MFPERYFATLEERYYGKFSKRSQNLTIERYWRTGKQHIGKCKWNIMDQCSLERIL